MTLLGLDVGDKKIGVAMASAGSTVATPHGTLLRAGGRAEKEILQLIEKYKIAEVIVGLPLSDDGSKNEQCLRVEQFCARLKKRVEVSIRFVDEYATSYEAEERLRAKGIASKEIRKKRLLDAAAAALILQSFLDSQNRSESR